MHRIAHAKAAGQVAQHVDAAKALHRRCQCRRHLRAVQQISCHVQPLLARFAQRRLQRRHRAPEQHQARALRGKGSSHRLAQVAGGAGHEHGFVFKVHAETP